MPQRPNETDRRRFNGAPAHQPGRHRRRAQERLHPRRFNGAPAHQPGRPAAPTSGRALRGLASMEPQLISRGDESAVKGMGYVRPLLQWSPSSSAGETAAGPTPRRTANALQWSPSSSAGETGIGRGAGRARPRGASMEPQLISRGDTPWRDCNVNAPSDRLQWSPSSSAGETPARRPRRW